MAEKEIFIGIEALIRIARGAELMAGLAAVTLGPAGRPVILERAHGAPTISRDGYEAACSLELEDALENQGARVILQAGAQSRDLVGDGATTAMLLASAMLHECVKAIVTGAKPARVRRGLELATEAAVGQLRDAAQPCRQLPALERLAWAVSYGDQGIATLAAQAVLECPDPGAITIEVAEHGQDTLLRPTGLRWNAGPLSSRFASDAMRGMVVLNNPYIVVSQDPLDSVDDMALLLERAAPLTQPLAVIAPAIAAPVLSMLLSNRTSGLVHCCAIGVPQAAQSEWLQDIATLTGATLVQRLAGQTLGDLRIDQWGMAERLESGRGSTQAVGMLPPEEDTVKSHIQIMRATLEATRDPAQRERIGARIARLSRQACILALADPDDQRGAMRLHLAERTLKVLRAAMSEGVVPGAGVGLVRARAALSNLQYASADESAGAQALRVALAEPLLRIASNAGEAPHVVMDAVDQGEGSFGFDAERGDFGDLAARNVIDSVAVVVNALRVATGVAGALLGTFCAVVDAPHAELERTREVHD
ncbi:chaperonin GroEL [Achromobacter insolitus]|uniref:chaperonin GroEL n=1 Tax=Achromobacter insolitus TaxID=217204 RepID=UPI0027E02F35|nr:chaperonin GroEL [Achromobacter insolitus]MDQ6211516.1 chaperonin GroEL [Achromobacter insolitus]